MSKKLSVSLLILVMLGQFLFTSQNAYAEPLCGDAGYGFRISGYYYVFSYDGDGQPQGEIVAYEPELLMDGLSPTTFQMVWDRTLCGWAARIPMGLTQYVKFDIDAVPSPEEGPTSQWMNFYHQLVLREWVPGIILVQVIPQGINVLFCPENVGGTPPSYIWVEDPKIEVIGPRLATMAWQWYPDWEKVGICSQAILSEEKSTTASALQFNYAKTKSYDIVVIPDRWHERAYPKGLMVERDFMIFLPSVAR
ncbi:MAG: hypothetical protein NUV65_02285 [Candidatus Roizmanbacteria bacterium]|nr:hypothetical protein [Candidatus Roizmanbacteria bacterium]